MRPQRLEAAHEPGTFACSSAALCDFGHLGTCPGYQGVPHRIGEDRSERLDVFPVQLRVLIQKLPPIREAASKPSLQRVTARLAPNNIKRRSALSQRPNQVQVPNRTRVDVVPKGTKD
jgi:hypothetical protein